MGRKILEVSDVFFRDILGNGERNYIVEGGLPGDAKVVLATVDQWNGMVHFIVESKEWPETQGGHNYPRFEPAIKTKISPESPREPIRFREFT